MDFLHCTEKHEYGFEVLCDMFHLNVQGVYLLSACMVIPIT